MVIYSWVRVLRLYLNIKKRDEFVGFSLWQALPGGLFLPGAYLKNFDFQLFI